MANAGKKELLVLQLEAEKKLAEKMKALKDKSYCLAIMQRQWFFGWEKEKTKSLL